MLDGGSGPVDVVRVKEFAEVATDYVGLVQAQDGLPGRVDRAEDAAWIDHRHQILRGPPGAVPLPGALLHLDG